MRNDKEKGYMLFLATILIAGTFTLGYFIVFAEIPEANKMSANTLMTALLAVITMIVTYYWGSSKGSSDKNDILSKEEPKSTIDTEMDDEQ